MWKFDKETLFMEKIEKEKKFGQFLAEHQIAKCC